MAAVVLSDDPDGTWRDDWPPEVRPWDRCPCGCEDAERDEYRNLTGHEALARIRAAGALPGVIFEHGDLP